VKRRLKVYEVGDPYHGSYRPQIRLQESPERTRFLTTKHTKDTKDTKHFNVLPILSILCALCALSVLCG
jgi:hypothetical protein